MLKKHRTTDALEILQQRFGNIPNWNQMVAEEDMKIRVGIAIYTLRTEARLTQEQMSSMIGVTQPMLSKIENADYDGSVLDMLWRVCKALGKEMEVSCLEPGTRERKCEVHAVPAHH